MVLLITIACAGVLLESKGVHVAAAHVNGSPDHVAPLLVASVHFLSFDPEPM
jgi:hypothetical protein